jgi:hypothetical protein
VVHLLAGKHNGEFLLPYNIQLQLPLLSVAHSSLSLYDGISIWLFSYSVVGAQINKGEYRSANRNDTRKQKSAIAQLHAGKEAEYVDHEYSQIHQQLSM